MAAAGRNRRRMLARAGALNALVLDAVLVTVVLGGGEVEAIVVLAPSVVGGVLALALPDNAGALGAAAALVLATAVFLIIGWIGFLFVLPVVLLFMASITRDGASTPPMTRSS